MDQVLSQQEIDQLLNAMNNGDITQESIAENPNDVKIKTYDFRRPTKLSKEYINTVHLIFEDFAKIATNVLSTQLRTMYASSWPPLNKLVMMNLCIRFRV